MRTDLRTHIAKGGTLSPSVVTELETALDTAARGVTVALSASRS